MSATNFKTKAELEEILNGFISQVDAFREEVGGASSRCSALEVETSEAGADDAISREWYLLGEQLDAIGDQLMGAWSSLRVVRSMSR